jgi:hypothetical protein
MDDRRGCPAQRGVVEREPARLPDHWSQSRNALLRPGTDAESEGVRSVRRREVLQNREPAVPRCLAETPADADAEGTATRVVIRAAEYR